MVMSLTFFITESHNHFMYACSFDSSRVLFGTCGNQSAGILYAQGKCPIMHHHPLSIEIMIGHLSWAYGQQTT